MTSLKGWIQQQVFIAVFPSSSGNTFVPEDERKVLEAIAEFGESYTNNLGTLVLAKKAAKLILLAAGKDAEKEFRSQFNNRLRVEMCNPYIDPEEDFLG